MYFSFWQLWTVAFWLTQLMAKLVTLLEQHMNRQPPTVVIQATTGREAVLAPVKLQEGGLGVHLHVKVCCYWLGYGFKVILGIATWCVSLFNSCGFGVLNNQTNGQLRHSRTTFRQTVTHSVNAGYNLLGGSTCTCQAQDGSLGVHLHVEVCRNELKPQTLDNYNFVTTPTSH